MCFLLWSSWQWNAIVLRALREGNPLVTGGSPREWPVTRSFDVSFGISLNKLLTNTRVAGELRRRDVSIMLYTHYADVTMSTMASHITSLTIVYSTVYSGTDQRKYQSSASLTFVRGIHRWPVNSPRKGPVTRKMFPFDDVIMISEILIETTDRGVTQTMIGDIVTFFPSVLQVGIGLFVCPSVRPSVSLSVGLSVCLG